MKSFLATIERERKTLEKKVAEYYLLKNFRLAFLPANLFLFWCLFSFSWKLFIISLLFPLIILPFAFSRKISFSTDWAARFFDHNFNFNDLLSTAYEFRLSKNESVILKELMNEADCKSKLIVVQPPDPRYKYERVFWVTLFLVLLLTLLFSALFSRNSLFSKEIATNSQQTSQNHPESQKSGKESQHGASNSKTQTEQEDKSSIPTSQGAITQKKVTNELEKLGETLTGNELTKQLGEKLKNHDFAQAAKEAKNLAEKFKNRLSNSEIRRLERTLQQAEQQVSSSANQDLKQAIQEMRKNVNTPSKLEDATNKLSEAIKNIQNKNELKGKEPQQGNKKSSQNKTSETPKSTYNQTQSELKSKSLNDKTEKTNGQASTKRPLNDLKNNEGSNMSNQNQKSQKPKIPTTPPNINSPNSKNNTPEVNKHQNQRSIGEDLKNNNQKVSDNENNNKGQGRGAGGQVLKDPREVLKEGYNGMIKIGDNNLSQDEIEQFASAAQHLSNFDKKAYQGSAIKINAVTSPEKIAKSREIDEFSQRYRIPNSFRTFLQNFYLHTDFPHK